MAGVKWIKITTDMFDNRKIKHLRKLPEGNNIVLIWVMLLTMAGRCNAGGMIFLTENIPYTPKMLADELGFEENTVKLALEALEQLDMVKTHESIFLIPGWEEHQNAEGLDRIREQSRKRMAKYRERQKQLCCNTNERNGYVTGNVTGRYCYAPEEEKEKEIDKDKEKENIYEPSDAPSGAIPSSEYPLADVAVAKEPKKPKKEKPVKHKYGEYCNVLLTDEELDKLKTKFPDWESKIDNLSCYIESKGAKYKSHYATIINWERREESNRKDGNRNGGSGYMESIQTRVSAVDDW